MRAAENPGRFKVATTTSLCDTTRGRPARPKSPSASTPPAANRLLHNSTVGRLTPTSSPIAVLLCGSAASNTMRARRSRPDANVEDRTHDSNTARSASDNDNGVTRIDRSRFLNH